MALQDNGECNGENFAGVLSQLSSISYLQM